MSKSIRVLTYSISIILLIWMILTVWVQYSTPQKSMIIGDEDSPVRILIQYNPDPIYNLDEQVCAGFAKGINEYGFTSQIATVKSIQAPDAQYDLYVFCANTYNWSPDWKTKNYLLKSENLRGQNVVAITVGSGSTSRAKRKLEEAILSKGANLLESRTYWLLRPNDETRLNEKNNLVATDMAMDLGRSIGMFLRENHDSGS